MTHLLRARPADGFRCDSRAWKVNWADEKDFELFDWVWFEEKPSSRCAHASMPGADCSCLHVQLCVVSSVIPFAPALTLHASFVWPTSLRHMVLRLGRIWGLA